MQIARNNGYNDNLVYRLIKKNKNIINKQKNPPTTLQPIKEITKDNNQFTTFNFTSNKIYKITKELQKNNINIAFKTNNNLKHKIPNKLNNYNNNDQYENCGVYKLSCQDCNKVYIGQTGRSFKTRYKEHISDYRFNRNKSTYAKHLSDYHHNPTTIENSLQILHKQKKGPKLNTLEQLEIYKHKNNIINENTINHNILYETYLNLTR